MDWSYQRFRRWIDSVSPAYLSDNIVTYLHGYICESIWCWISIEHAVSCFCIYSLRISSKNFKVFAKVKVEKIYTFGKSGCWEGEVPFKHFKAPFEVNNERDRNRDRAIERLEISIKIAYACITHIIFCLYHICPSN